MTVTLDTLLPKEEGLVVRFQLSQLAQLSIGAMGFKTERFEAIQGWVEMYSSMLTPLLLTF